MARTVSFTGGCCHDSRLAAAKIFRFKMYTCSADLCSQTEILLFGATFYFISSCPQKWRQFFDDKIVSGVSSLGLDTI